MFRPSAAWVAEKFVAAPISFALSRRALNVSPAPFTFPAISAVVIPIVADTCDMAESNSMPVFTAETPNAPTAPTATPSAATRASPAVFAMPPSFSNLPPAESASFPRSWMSFPASCAASPISSAPSAACSAPRTISMNLSFAFCTAFPRPFFMVSMGCVKLFFMFSAPCTKLSLNSVALLPT